MIWTTSLLLVLALALLVALAARARARRRAAAGGQAGAAYAGWYAALWTGLPAAGLTLGWALLSPALVTARVLASPLAARLPPPGLHRGTILAEARARALDPGRPALDPLAAPLIPLYREAIAHAATSGLALAVLAALAGGAWAWHRGGAHRTPGEPRRAVEAVIRAGLLLASLVAILTTFGILAALLFETVRFFHLVSPAAFLLGRHWAPDPMAVAEQAAGADYGALAPLWGTLYIGAGVAMVVALPLGLLAAIWLGEYAGAQARGWLKPALELLAGIPTVVYGAIAALAVAPLVRSAAVALGFAGASGESALAAGMVMGVMIVPLVTSLADDALRAVPPGLRDGSLALGATRRETIVQVLLPAALPGIVAGIMLAISRAIGETMIVVMAAGAAARITLNPFAGMTTVTYQIVALLTGEGGFDHPATLSAFALGMLLFAVTLALNLAAFAFVRRFREAYG